MDSNTFKKIKIKNLKKLEFKMASVAATTSDVTNTSDLGC